MKKQTKVVAVLSAAALLAMGASMTSFAAGWEKDDEGIWHYYDADGDMVTSDWAKDGSNWYYLDEDGNMLTDSWVDDDYYVGSDGAMLKNQWVKTFADDEDQSEPDESGEHWYYFGAKGKKVSGTHEDKKINGKTYYFDEDGKMYSGWQEFDNNVYYLGGEDEGWRAESQWLWLEKSSVAADDDNDDDTDDQAVLGCTEDDDCDDEGWYWFQSSGKMYKDAKKKKINGHFFMFNDHGQMLYEWIDKNTKLTLSSNAALDGKATPGEATIGDMLWYKENGNASDDGSRYTGWMQIDGSEDVDTDTDTDWYYFKDSKAKHADVTKDFNGLYDGEDPVYTMREKINGKYFCFNEKGQMQDGLQLIGANLYYFDNDGYQQTGKISNVEEDDDDTYYYYFQTKNNGNGKGYDGPKDDVLYFLGKRLEAQDSYRIYNVNGKCYLVNTKGKIQKTKGTDVKKKVDLEKLDGTSEDDVTVTISSGKVVSVDKGNLDDYAEVPHIELKDDWIYPVPGKDGGKAIVNKQYLENVGDELSVKEATDNQDKPAYPSK